MAAGAAAASVALSGPSAPTLLGRTPRQIERAAVAAARAAGPFQLVSGHLDAYVGPDWTAVSGTPSGFNLTVDEIGGKLYMQASGTLWDTVVGTSGAAAVLDGRLIQISSEAFGPDGAPPALSGAAVVSSFVALRGPLSMAPPAATPAGTVAIRGTLPDTPLNHGAGAGRVGTLVVSATAPFYPLRLSYSDRAQGAVTFVFSRWGVHRPAPSVAGAVSWSTVQALLHGRQPPQAVRPGGGPTPAEAPAPLGSALAWLAWWVRASSPATASTPTREHPPAPPPLLAVPAGPALAAVVVRGTSTA